MYSRGVFLSEEDVETLRRDIADFPHWKQESDDIIALIDLAREVFLLRKIFADMVIDSDVLALAARREREDCHRLVMNMAAREEAGQNWIAMSAILKVANELLRKE